MNEDISARDKLCPKCDSQTLTRIHRTWWQRVSGWAGNTRRYRCLFCGYEFLERMRARDDPPPSDSDSEEPS
jgi:DNA-directed RNA polymerase subunit RPC12/RpoP